MTTQQTQPQAPATTAPQQAAPATRPKLTGLALLKNSLKAPSVVEQFQNALKDNAPTFIASLIDLYNTDSKLQQCDPNQVICEALKAAVLNLPINKALGQAFIIPYNNTITDEKDNRVKKYEPTFQIGYKGIYQLAMRTNQYRIINADVVYEGELRKVSRLTGEIDLDGAKLSDKVVGYFAYFELMDGYRKALYMSVEEMAAHAKRYSKALMYKKEATIDYLISLAALPVGASTAVGWIGNFHGMAIKTVLRNLLGKYGYLSVALQKALNTDQESEKGESKAISAPSHNAQVVDVATVDYVEVSDQNAPTPAATPESEPEPEINPGF